MIGFHLKLNLLSRTSGRWLSCPLWLSGSVHKWSCPDQARHQPARGLAGWWHARNCLWPVSATLHGCNPVSFGLFTYYVSHERGWGGVGKCWQKLTKGGGGVDQMLTIADKGGGGQKNFQQWEFRGSKIVDSEKNWCKFYLKHWAKPNYMQIGPQQMNIAHVVISKSLW